MNKEEIKKQLREKKTDKVYHKEHLKQIMAGYNKVTAEYDEDIVELEKKLKQQDIFPQDGDWFSYLEDDLETSQEQYISDDDRCNDLVLAGNCYKNDEKATKARDQQLAITRIKKYIKVNFGYDPDDWVDWTDITEKKYTIVYSYMYTWLYQKSYLETKVQSFIGYLKTEEEVKALIKNLKEELELVCK